MNLIGTIDINWDAEARVYVATGGVPGLAVEGATIEALLDNLRGAVPALLEANISRLTEDEGGGFVATIPGLPGCMGDGETPDAAETDAREAAKAWLEAAGDRLIRASEEANTADCVAG